MSIAKIRIDLSVGLLEAEGSEEFVLNVYNSFNEKIGASFVVKGSEVPSDIQKTQPAQVKNDPEIKKVVTPKPKKRANGQMPSIVKDLDLSGGVKCERLKDFYATYDAKSNFDKNLIFIYYIDHKLGLGGITTDHIFTCYRDILGIKVPEALRQSLIDTSNRKGWIDTSDMDNLKITTPGINFLEHDMPKKGSSE